VRFGHFDDDRREYVITRPDTPLPWIDYLGADEYIALVSNTGGGYSFYRDARLRRLIRGRYNAAPLDLGGRYLYLRDDDGGDAWSPTWQPMRRELDAYECRHGLGYTSIEGTLAGIRAAALYVVPPSETLELWRTRVTNERATPARLSLFAAVEFCLWDAWDDATNFQRNYSIGEVELEDGVVYHTTEYRERRDHFAWFAASERPVGSDTQRDAFLGPYRGWDSPVAVDVGRCSGSVAHGWQPIAAHHLRIELEPGESHEVVFGLGYAENPREAKFDPPGSGRLDKRRVRPVIDRWLRPGAVEEALRDLRDRWEETLGRLQVSTPEPHLDRMVNTWNAYQCMVTLNVSRSASMFESGIGRGIGFRDSNQDLLGAVHMAPERARQRLLDTAATQLPSGAAYHQYQPLTKRGNPAIGMGFNDDPAWLVVAAGAYVRESGDLGILDEPVPFDDEPGTEVTFYEHLRRSIDYTLERLGPHGLPLIGRADWNDCLNLNAFSVEPGESFQTTAQRPGGVAESVFIAGLFILACRDLAAMAERRDDAAEVTRCGRAAEAMRRAVEAHGWDGAWFLRAYGHEGRPLGTAADEEGRIFVEPQGMCVMAGVGVDDGRAAIALDSVREHLATPHGIALVTPPFSRYRPELGEITSYPPGYKENGSVFCHVNPWVVIAETIAGTPEAALDHYLRINPSAREAISDIHRCEPYVYAQTIAGPAAPTFGEAKNSWLTGTAAWNLVAATQWILGVRPELDGLRLDPRLPATWGDVHVTRSFRGAVYRIHIRKEAGATGRVGRLVVDGTPLTGNLAPLPRRLGQEIVVEAVVEPDVGATDAGLPGPLTPPGAQP
jgi:cellobiose phosphorylase